MDKQIWTDIFRASIPYLVPAFMAMASFFALKYFAKHKEDVKYATAALKLIKQLLGNKLGDKGTAVFDAFLKGLDAVKDGDFTQAEMIDHFMQFVHLTMADQNMALSETELADVKDVADIAMELIGVKKKPTAAAVSMMMVS